MANKVHLLILFVLFVLNANAQEQPAQKTRRDTVYIYKEPLIIKKTVVWDPKVKRRWMADVFINTSYVFNSYTYCSCNPIFNPVYKGAMSNSLTYGAGINLSRKFNKFVLTASIQYLSIRNKLSYKDTISNDSYNYINTGLLGGYQIGKKKFTFIPAAGVVLTTLLGGSGKTIAAGDLNWQGLNISQQYYKTTIDLTLRLKLQYKLSEHTAFFMEPYVLHDMQNITKNVAPFGLQRTITGINMGITFFLK
jgi:hypothetical protein